MVAVHAALCTDGAALMRPRMLYCPIHGRFIWRGFVDCLCGLRWNIMSEEHARYRAPDANCSCGKPLVAKDDSGAMLACVRCEPLSPTVVIEKRAVGYVARLWRDKDGTVTVHKPEETTEQLVSAVAIFEHEGTLIDSKRQRIQACGEGCQSDDDGDCNWAECPQLRDGEPERSGRHCPRDKRHEDSEL